MVPNLMHRSFGTELPEQCPSPRHQGTETRAQLFAGDQGAAAAWPVFMFNWRLLASVTGVVAAGLMATKFYIRPSGYVIVFAIAALYWQFGVHNARSAARSNPKVSYCLIAIAQMILAVSVMTTLTYLAMSTDLPLKDASLLAWDRAFGLDFRDYLQFVNTHPSIMRVLAPCYSSINWQMLAVVLLLPFTRQYQRCAEFICAFTLALIATTCISTLVPAIGVYHILGLHPSDYPNFVPQGYYGTLRDAPLVRAGSLHGLSLLQLGGILTFPSFHAVSAVLYVWAFWPMSRLRWLVVPWNLAMIAATPLGGGHYFVDVLAGVLVAATAICAALGISNLLRPTDPTLCQPMRNCWTGQRAKVWAD